MKTKITISIEKTLNVKPIKISDINVKEKNVVGFQR